MEKEREPCPQTSSCLKAFPGAESQTPPSTGWTNPYIPWYLYSWEKLTRDNGEEGIGSNLPNLI